MQDDTQKGNQLEKNLLSDEGTAVVSYLFGVYHQIQKKMTCPSYSSKRSNVILQLHQEKDEACFQAFMDADDPSYLRIKLKDYCDFSRNMTKDFVNQAWVDLKEEYAVLLSSECQSYQKFEEMISERVSCNDKIPQKAQEFYEVICDISCLALEAEKEKNDLFLYNARTLIGNSGIFDLKNLSDINFLRYLKSLAYKSCYRR